MVACPRVHVMGLKPQYTDTIRESSAAGEETTFVIPLLILALCLLSLVGLLIHRNVTEKCALGVKKKKDPCM